MQRLEKGYRKGAVGQMAAYALVGSFVWQRQPASGLFGCIGPVLLLTPKPRQLASFALLIDPENQWRSKLHSLPLLVKLTSPEKPRQPA